jgi:hypothetical protein
MLFCREWRSFLSKKWGNARGVFVEIARFLLLKRGKRVRVEISGAKCLKLQFLSKRIDFKWTGDLQNMRSNHTQLKSDFKNKQM